jgi:ATP-dependent Zn protease
MPLELLPPDTPRLGSLHGMAAARGWGESLARDLGDFKAGRIAWSQVDPGVLVYGGPGTGKTLFARALAVTCQVPLIATSYAEWQRNKDGHLGDVLKAMHSEFELARTHAPCILFIDEIEAVGSRETKGDNQRWYTNIITALNTEINGVLGRDGVVVIAAANYPDRIDPALLRSGRLDSKIAIPMPNAKDLEGILRFHLDKNLPDADLVGLAAAMVGSTGADVGRLVRLAGRRARLLRRPLRLQDLFATLGERLVDMPRPYLERIALHEAGHVVAAVVLGVASNVSVSLFHVGERSAATLFDPQFEALTREVVERRIAVALAGRAAEEVILGDVTAGAAADLGLANTLAFWAVARWGLSDRDDVWWHDGSVDQIVAAHPGLKKAAHRLLDGAYTLAKATIESQSADVKAIAGALLKRRALAHGDIMAILGRARPAKKAVRRKASGAG